jgi:hypothetical protein
LDLIESSKPGSVTVTLPTAALSVPGSAVPKNGTLTAPLVPAAPMWMWPAVGAAMPFHFIANEIWLPLIRSTSTACPSLSPTAGEPAGPGTSLRPLSVATR